MKKVILLAALLASTSPCFAATHDGNVIDNVPYQCSGIINQHRISSGKVDEQVFNTMEVKNNQDKVNEFTSCIFNRGWVKVVHYTLDENNVFRRNATYLALDNSDVSHLFTATGIKNTDVLNPSANKHYLPNFGTFTVATLKIDF